MSFTVVLAMSKGGCRATTSLAGRLSLSEEGDVDWDLLILEEKLFKPYILPVNSSDLSTGRQRRGGYLKLTELSFLLQRTVHYYDALFLLWRFRSNFLQSWHPWHVLNWLIEMLNIVRLSPRALQLRLSQGTQLFNTRLVIGFLSWQHWMINCCQKIRLVHIIQQ